MPALTTAMKLVRLPISVSMLGRVSESVSWSCSQSATASNRPPTVKTANAWKLTAALSALCGNSRRRQNSSRNVAVQRRFSRR